MDETIEIDGEYTTAEILIDDVEDITKEQIQEIVNQPPFVNDVKVMPDAHPGEGSVIGFTMPVSDKIPPRTVGVDVGCGLFAGRLPGCTDIHDNDHRAILEDKIREYVPVGYSTHSDGIHMHNEFPYEECQEKLDTFNKHSDFDHIDVDYDPDYYNDLISRIDVSFHKVSNSMGTLGGGNHFIEIADSDLDNYEERDSYYAIEPFWVVIHSGSRQFGYKVCEYWKQVATEEHDNRADRIRGELEQHPDDYVKFDPESVSDKELLDWMQGGMGEDFINYQAIPKLKREQVKDELKSLIPQGKYDGSPYDWLEGENAKGYIADMIFAQTYASVNRREMADNVLKAWYEAFFEDMFVNPDEELPDELIGDELEFVETIESVHNYIDFEDQIIRKGATRAHEGEKAVVPYNMADGTIIVEGKGNPDWNYSVNHGAGRVDSRGWAGHQITQEEANEQIRESDVHASVVPRDESPHAYKDPQMIEESMGPAADVVNRLDPLISIKAETRYYDEEE